MDHFIIQVSIPSGEHSFLSRIYRLQAPSLQAAVDMAFSREIYRGEQILDEKSLLNQEPVVKREDVLVVAQYVFDEKGGLREKLVVNDGNERLEGQLVVKSIFDPQIPQKWGYQHPSRLTDSAIKQLLLEDVSINKIDIDATNLEKMVFLI